LEVKEMDVGLVLKVAGVGMLVTVAHQILSKAGRDEQAMLVSLAGIVIVLVMLIGEIGGLIETVRSVFGL
jgi:stage III sporulation protein AC